MPRGYLPHGEHGMKNKIKQLEIAVEMGYREYKNKKARTENPYTLASLRIAYDEGQDEAELELNEINLADGPVNPRRAVPV